MHYTVIDRATQAPRAMNKTAAEVVEEYVEVGAQLAGPSSPLALLQSMRPNQRLMLGDIIVVARPDPSSTRR